MKIIKKIKSIQNKIINLKKNKKIGLVPTMGFLHEGHISLIKKSVKENDITVLTIFVNPKQFGPNEDLEQYPKDLKKDLKIAKENNVDFVFIPDIKEMYPSNYSTYIKENNISKVLEGKLRPGHFDGVTTIVLKLFNIIPAHNAYFGQKDAQQFIIIKKMVKDLNLPINIIKCKIIRDKNGLALSSRNIYLTEKEYISAIKLNKILLKAKKLFLMKNKSVKKIINDLIKEIKKDKLIKLQYLEIKKYPDFSETNILKEGKYFILIAAFIGKARLIDNVLFNMKNV